MAGIDQTGGAAGSLGLIRSAARMAVCGYERMFAFESILC
jgi:hypothetical protein